MSFAHRTALWFFVCFALTACNPTHLDVLRSSPTPHRPHTPRIAIESVHTELLRVNGRWEEEWAVERSASQAERWESDKVELDARFRRALFDRSAGVTFVSPAQLTADDWILRPSVTSIEPRNAWAGSGQTSVDITVQLVTASGHIVDEVVLFTRVTGNWSQLTITDQMRAAGTQLGSRYGAYLSDRLAGVAPSGRRIDAGRVDATSQTPLPPGYLAAPTDIARVPRPSRLGRELQNWGLALVLVGHISSGVIPAELAIFGYTPAWEIQIPASSVPVVGSFVIAATLPSSSTAIAIVAYSTGAIGVVGLGLALAGFLLPPERPAPLRTRGPISSWSVQPLQFAGSNGFGLGIGGAF